MSDFVFVAGGSMHPTTRLLDHYLRVSCTTDMQVFESDEFHLAVTRPGDQRQWAPLHDSDTGIFFAVMGRPVSEFLNEAVVAGSGESVGVRTKLLFERYRRNGLGAFSALHGSFSVLAYHPQERRLFLHTDRLGAQPVYYCTKAGVRVPCISTHPDLLARLCDAEELDMLSLAEQLHCGRCVFPYTHFRNIREIEPASHIEFDLDPGRVRQGRRYWSPEFRPRHDARKNADELAAAIRNAVTRRTVAGEGNIGVFLSGGADSRNIVLNGVDRDRLHAITLCDSPNRETRVAQTIARRAGVSHHLIERDPDYYPRNAPRALFLANGMWNFVDGHFVGIEKKIHELAIDKVLTGCYADFLFKGLTQNRRRLQIGRHKLPLYRKTAFQIGHGYLWRLPILPTWIPGIRQRLEEQVRHVSQDVKGAAGELQLEAVRTFPLSRAPGAASRSSLWKLHAWEPVFIDNEILDAYQKIPPGEKLNGTTFFRAVDQVCADASDIPNANDGLPMVASPLRKMLWAIGRMVVPNRGKDVFAGTVATDGSWPNWNRVKMLSTVMEHHWMSFRKENRELLQEILGPERMARRPAEWPDGETELLCRTYSLLLWLETLHGQSWPAHHVP